MKMHWGLLAIAFFSFCCKSQTKQDKATSDTTFRTQETITDTNNLQLPAPYATESVRNNSKVIGWPQGKMPIAPQGFSVSIFADSLAAPRWIYTVSNGDIFVAQADREGKKGNNIILYRDANKDGVPESSYTYLSGLNQPFGMLVLNNKFYVGNTDALWVYPYDPKATSITASGKKIASFPTGRHWTRNVVASKDGSKIYVSVGSSSNVAENGIDKETRRANILVMDPDGSNERIFANGLRNPVGMAWAPGTNTLWTVVNERDELGDDLVPDYLTSVRDSGFYGWPYSYYGQHLDPRIKDNEQRPDLVQRAIVPDVALGSHVAALGLTFYTGNQFPSQYQNGAFIGEHGSWNRSHLVGYQIVFVPFANGKPSDKPHPFLTGFIADDSKSEVFGRPVGVTMIADGSLLIADDGAGRIWRVTYNR